MRIQEPLEIARTVPVQTTSNIDVIILEPEQVEPIPHSTITIAEIATNEDINETVRQGGNIIDTHISFQYEFPYILNIKDFCHHFLYRLCDICICCHPSFNLSTHVYTSDIELPPTDVTQIHSFLLMREHIIESYIAILLLNTLYTCINPFNIICFILLLLNLKIIIDPDDLLLKCTNGSNLLCILFIALSNIFFSITISGIYQLFLPNTYTFYVVTVVYTITLYLSSLFICLVYIYLMNSLNKIRIMYKHFTPAQLFIIHQL